MVTCKRARYIKLYMCATEQLFDSLRADDVAYSQPGLHLAHETSETCSDHASSAAWAAGRDQYKRSSISSTYVTI